MGLRSRHNQINEDKLVAGLTSVVTGKPISQAAREAAGKRAQDPKYVAEVAQRARRDLHR